MPCFTCYFVHSFNLSCFFFTLLYFKNVPSYAQLCKFVFFPVLTQLVLAAPILKATHLRFHIIQVSIASNRNHPWVAQEREGIHWKDSGMCHRILGRAEQLKFQKEGRRVALVTSAARQHKLLYLSITTNII